MAFKMAKVDGDQLDWQERSSNEQWWEAYVANLTTDMMEDICHRVLDYYN